MKLQRLKLSLAVALAASAGAHAELVGEDQINNAWYADAQTRLQAKIAEANKPKASHAKNVILFVGDGMGISTLTASRILQGQRAGNPGEEGYLSFEEFPYSALVKTYNVNAQTPDSAGTMTAMMSGLKTDVGVIGVDENIEQGKCSTAAGNEVITALELAEIKGLSTGIVSTARITHATPAATYAHSAHRNWEDISDMGDQAGKGCNDIADQLVNFENYLEQRYQGVDVDGIEVAMGGGRRHFLPKDATANSTDAVSSVEGDRTDKRNLITEWKKAYPKGVYVMDQTGFNAIDASRTERVLGLFNESHMQYEADRANDVAGEPSIAEMTKKAIDILDNNQKGFFLMVESGRIDHAHHAGNAAGGLNETIAFSDAVKAAVDNTNPEETLILVTADHSHVFTIAGYPKRGNPILGKVVGVGKTEPSLAADNQPYTTVGYMNGRGFADFGAETNSDVGYGKKEGDPSIALADASQITVVRKDTVAVTGRIDLSGVNTETAGYHQETLVPLSSETHAGEDITLHAKGPGAHMVQGVIEQSVVFHIINRALGLTGK